jgi:transcriptional regulator with XRE-family HTH domain
MKKETSSKYKYTKQILKLAHQDGMSYADIAVKAGISANSKNQVNKWITGKSLATQRQMQFFINAYSSALKRKMEHLFYSDTNRIKITENLLTTIKNLQIYAELNIPSDISDNNSPLEKCNLAILTTEQKDYLLTKILPNELFQHISNPIFHAIKNNEISRSSSGLQFCPNFFKLNGEVVFKHTIYLRGKISHEKTPKIAHKRFLLLQADNLFHLISQERIKDFQNQPLCSSNEDSLWDSSTKTFIELNDVLQSIDEFTATLLEDRRCIGDSITIPFIARQALLKQGFALPDVIDLSAESEIIKEPQKG